MDDDFWAEFERQCSDCEHNLMNPDLSSSKCKFNGISLKEIHFKIKQYFNLAFPQNVCIPCPVFIDLKRMYDTKIKQAPVIEVLGKYKEGTGQEFFEE